MRIAVIALAATVAFTSSAIAEEVGGGFSVGGEIDTSFNMDTENFNILLTPEAKYVQWGAEFTVDIPINVYDQDQFTLNDAFDKPMINFGMTYGLPIEGATAYAETTYNVDAGDTEASKVGVTFSF